MYRGLIPLMGKGLKPFIIEVKTDNTGTSSSTQFTIPTTGLGYLYTVKTSEQTLVGRTGSTTLTWASPGTYDIEIFGAFPRIFFNNAGDRLKLLKVKQWGGIRWSSFAGSFFGCANLDVTATDTPSLSLVTSLSDCFRSCTLLINSNNSIGSWNTSAVTTMASMFVSATSFNQNIGSWNVSNVTIFTTMFFGATSFNNGGSNDINNWQIKTNATVNMQQMFRSASSFNQPIGSWNVSAVTTMFAMFQNATIFNQDITSWNISNVTSLNAMFNGANAFNQDISSWNVSSATTLASMFAATTSFNQNLGSWALRLTAPSLVQIFQSANGMSTANYTDTIVGWANYVFVNGGSPSNVSMTTQSGRTFQNSLSGGANFANAGLARTYLTTATPTGAAWTISGDSIIP
jgi:surface protein